MRVTRNVVLSTAAVLMVAALPAFGQAKLGVVKTFHIGGVGGFDYMTVDAESHRLFTARGTHTQVIDENTGKLLADIPGQKESHGVAIVSAVNRGFISDGGGDGAVVIFDLKTYKVLGSLKTVPDTDGIIYDASSNRVLATAGDSAALISIDPSVDPKSGTFDKVDLGGKPEFLASDSAGKVYVNMEDKDVVAEVDLNAKKVVARWAVAPGGAPVGMSIDPATHRLFIGARNPQKLIVMDAENGKVLEVLPIGKVVDATSFDAGQAFASCVDGTMTVAGEQNGKFVVEQVVTTAKGAKTLGIDHQTHMIYLPTADVVPGLDAKGHLKFKAGTFKIVVVGRQ